MTQVATPATLIPEARNVELSFAGRQYRLEQKGDKLFVSSRSLGETEYGPPNQVVLLTGSHNLQILWTETGQGRTLEQFPFAYIIAEKMWAPVAQTFLMPPGDEGGLLDRRVEWRLHGLSCHAGIVEVCRGQQMGHEGRRIRDRLRSLP